MTKRLETKRGAKRRILVFDSGLGGLTVARALRAAGEAQVVLDYAADTAAFPYGGWPEQDLRNRIVTLMGRLIEQARPDVVVIACNTASVVALSALRAAFDVPFVGTVPAIKPAAARTRSGIIGVLATPGTVRREYTQALIHTYAFHCRVILHGAAGLAALAEARLAGAAVDDNALLDEIAPVFVREGDARTDQVVLGCTHYPLLLEEMQEIAPWPVEFIDPSAAIARRALEVAGSCAAHDAGRGGCVYVTSGKADTAAQRVLFAREGFASFKVLDTPVDGRRGRM